MKKKYHQPKKSAPSSSTNNSTRTGQKHQTTESVGDDDNDIALNSNTSNVAAPLTSPDKSSAISLKLRLCYDRLIELEKNANEFNEKGNKEEANEFFLKAKESRKEIEKLLKQVSYDKKKQPYNSQRSSNNTNQSTNNNNNNLSSNYDVNNSTNDTSPPNTNDSSTASSSSTTATSTDSREALILKMIDTNFSDPTPALIAEGRAKGFDLTKKSAKILMSEMCRELMKTDSLSLSSSPVSQVTKATTSTTTANNNLAPNSSSTSNGHYKKATNTSSSSSSTSTTFASSASVVFTSALKGVHHYNNISNNINSPTTTTSSSSSAAATAASAALQEKWRSEAFLEKVMIKVRRRESNEMAIRIVDEITLPSLRLLAATRLKYTIKTPLYHLLMEHHKNKMIQKSKRLESTSASASSTSKVTSGISATTASNSNTTTASDTDVFDAWLNEIVVYNVPDMLCSSFSKGKLEDVSGYSDNHVSSNGSNISNNGNTASNVADAVATNNNKSSNIDSTNDTSNNTNTNNYNSNVNTHTKTSTATTILRQISRQDITPPLVAALTEDIYEVEILQAQASLQTLKKLRAKQMPYNGSNTSNKQKEKKEREKMILEEKKKEIDDHGDRVYEMMVDRYGIGSVEDIEAAASNANHDGDRTRSTFANSSNNSSGNNGNNNNNNNGSNGHHRGNSSQNNKTGITSRQHQQGRQQQEEDMLPFGIDRHFLIGQVTYISVAVCLFFILASTLMQTLSASQLTSFFSPPLLGSG